ncbi:hypothetical protein RI129_001315 [Pyrocoelia pectoralis]|uniref:MADF domain-containing protein n=1 Tax=Pyrocoelia pectoralis TaxID=417401 RepID=A0AAN7ZX59_9COLE
MSRRGRLVEPRQFTSNVRFSKAEDEMLVEKVREFPTLYDHENMDFKDFQIRENIWREICNDFIRDTYTYNARFLSTFLPFCNYQGYFTNLASQLLDVMSFVENTIINRPNLHRQINVNIITIPYTVHKQQTSETSTGKRQRTPAIKISIYLSLDNEFNMRIKSELRRIEEWDEWLCFFKISIPKYTETLAPKLIGNTNGPPPNLRKNKNMTLKKYKRIMEGLIFSKKICIN